MRQTTQHAKNDKRHTEATISTTKLFRVQFRQIEALAADLLACGSHFYAFGEDSFECRNENRCLFREVG